MDKTDELKEMKRRRVKGARLLKNGERPAQVARELGVSRQSVMRWGRRLQAGGVTVRHKGATNIRHIGASWQVAARRASH